VDYLGDPYPAAIQRALQEGRLGLVSDAELATELRSQPGMLPNALVQEGPTVSAAAWLVSASSASLLNFFYRSYACQHISMT
jgi:hypothetical protein